MDNLEHANQRDRIVIIGMACRYPGANDYKEYWDNLVNGKNLIKEIPRMRWDTSRYYNENINTPNTSMSKWCGIVDEIETFDYKFFSISEREAKNMDPQQRLLLQETWHCIEDSAVLLKELQEKTTAVYVGTMAVDYRQEAVREGISTDSFACLGNYENMLANRISYIYNLHGKSVSINAACASSLIALSEAQHAIERGECEYAIVAGVSLNTHPWKYISFSKSRMLSPTGQCRTFDYAADGYVPGDGIGVVLVTKESLALKNHCRIHGIIRGSASNHVGKGNSITAPSIMAQKTVIISAMKDANVNAEEITYVEAHGTGTSLGDPIEVEALSQAFQRDTNRLQFCTIGSVKANIGHLEAAAGIASVIKVLLMMRHKEIPPQINLTQENPIIDFANSPFLLTRKKKSWEQREGANSRIAGISSFGFGGANCHMIMEEYPEEKHKSVNDSTDTMILTLSARTKESLSAMAREWKAYVHGKNESELKSAFMTQLLGRESFELRRATVAGNLEECEKFFHEVIETETEKHVINRKLLYLPDCHWEEKAETKDRVTYKKRMELLKSKLEPSDAVAIERIMEQDNLAKNPKVLGFLLHYCELRLLMKCGYHPDWIDANGTGHIMAWALSRMITFDEAVRILIQPKSVEISLLQPPIIPYYDHKSGRIITGMQIKKDYVTKLSDELNHLTMKEWKQVEKAKQLILYQHTFINYMKEWKQIFVTYTKEEPSDLITDEKKFAQLTDQQIVLLVIAIIHSLSKVYMKWEIREDRLKNPEVINEVCDLLNEGVITMEQIPKLMGFVEDGWKECFDAICMHQERIHLERGYHRLKECIETRYELNLRDLIQEDIAETNKDIVSLENQELILVGKCDLEIDAILAKLWEYGVSIDWKEIYPRGKQELCDIPQYAFAGKQFWIYQKEERAEEEFPQSVIIQKAHPEICNHIIQGKVLVPAAKIILSFLKPYKACYDNVAVEGLILRQPLDFMTDNLYELSIVRGENLNELRNGNEVIASCKIENAARKQERKNWNCEQPGNQKTEIYHVLHQAGFEYQGCYQIFNSYQYKDHSWNFIPNISVANETSIVDAAFQAALFVVYQQGQIDMTKYQNLPYYCGRIQISSDLMNTKVITLEERDISVKGNDIYATVKGFNAAGETTIVIENAVLKHVKRKSREENTICRTIKERASFYGVGWKKKKLEVVEAFQERAAIILSEHGTKLAEELEAHYRQIHPMSYSHMSEEGCLTCFQEILTQQGNDKNGVDIYLYLELTDHKRLNSEDIYEEFYKRVNVTLYIAKGLSKIRHQGNIRILVLSDDKGDSNNNIISCGVAGFLRSAVKELAKTQFKYVSMMDALSLEDLARVMVRECQAIGDCQIISYQKGQRYIEAYVKYENGVSGKSEAGIQADGAYIITGGAGKLGLKVAAGLIAKGVRSIVLLGRRKPSAEITEKVKGLSLGSGNVVYQSCDITDRQQLARMLESIKETYGQIKGIVHAAGVLNDGLLGSKTKDSMEPVIKTKVYGSLLLHELTKNEPLQFFMTFSSIVSCIGNVGQADYSAANYFLDCLTEFRYNRNASGKSISINWSLWEDGGMGLTEQHKRIFSNKTGLLRGNDGIKSILDALNQVPNRLAVISNEEEFEQLIQKQLYNEVNEKEMIDINQTIIYEEISTMLSDILEIPVAEIQSETDLREFGMESILITELSEKLNDIYGIHIDGTFFFECNTIKDLVDYIMKNGRQKAEIIEDIKPFNHSEAAKSLNHSEDEKDYVCKELISILAEILDMEESDLDTDTDLREFGMESILLTDFCEKINERLGVEMNPSILFEYVDMDNIAKYLVTKYPSQFSVCKEVIPTKKQEAEFEARAEEIPEDAIVIVGLSGRFPMSEHVDEYWRRLLHQENMITEVQENRWSAKNALLRSEEKGCGTKVKWGGFLKEVDRFDGDFFKISRREAELMDPQQRMMLEESWHALEDAGIVPSEVVGKKVGVYVGVANTDYNDLIVKYDVPYDYYTSTGSFFSIIPNRISYFFDWKGPSIAIDTACSSSLVAIHEAVKAIQSGECDMALAGGVNAILQERKHISFTDAGMLCEDGQCKTFDERANGYVRGEGAGIVVLKRYRDAKKDHNPIYARVCGSAVNHGGAVGSITRPNPNAQAEVIRDAYVKAGFHPETIDYIEVHGTGTNLGDPVEINGLKKAFTELYQQYQEPEKIHTCGIGSVKTNIGHLESAAGVAGLIKILKAMKEGIIPGTRNVVKVNPMIQLEQSPFYIVKNNQEWKNKVIDHKLQPKRAGISSFGFGGVNAHIALEEVINSEQMDYGTVKPVFLLSAKTDESLKDQVLVMKDYLSACKEQKTYDQCLYTLQTGREHLEERLAFVAFDAEEATRILSDYLEKGDLSLVKRGFVKKNKQKTEIFQEEIKQASPESLAEQFVQGKFSDWKLFYQDSKIMMCSLPGYQFAKERYWLPMGPDKTKRTDTSEGNNSDRVVLYKKIYEKVENPAISSHCRQWYVICEDDMLREELSADETFHECSVRFLSKYSARNVKSESEDGFVWMKDFRGQEKFGENTCDSTKELFEFLKGLLGQKQGKRFVKVIMLQNAGEKNAEAASIQAFLKSLKEEPIPLELETITIQMQSGDTGIAKCLCEALAYTADQYQTMLYLNNIWFKETYVERMPEFLQIRQDYIRQEGVYLIAGGTGRIGSSIALKLLKEKKCNLILCGTRERLSQELQGKLENANIHGSRIIYKSVDFQKRDQVEDMIASIYKEYQEIHGVFYCAGSIRDQFLYTKPWEEYRYVFDSKVTGVLLLAGAIHEMDFFLICSSYIADRGNAGQTDYAAANAYIDTWVELQNERFRRSGRKESLVSINWPLWSQTTMSHQDTEYAQLELMGIKPMPEKIGLEMMDYALSNQIQRLSFGYGDGERILTGMQTSHPYERTKGEKISVARGMHKQGKVGVLRFLKQCFSDCAKVEPESIDPDIDFGDYGMDSFMVKEMNLKLSKRFPTLSKTILYEKSNMNELADYLCENYSTDFMDSVEGEEVRQEAEDYEEDEIAIISMSGRFPKAEHLEQFWSNLKQGVDCITEIPKERWDAEALYSEERTENGKMYCKWGGFVDHVDEFDALFFNISPKEAEMMDPQERIFLETTYELMENAGYTKETLTKMACGEKSVNVGVFAGVTTNTYSLWGPQCVEQGIKGIPNSFEWSLANRVSYFWNFSGPSIPVDTACSSSLTAVHLACESLKRGECEMAIVGGVNLYLHPLKYTYLCSLNMLSPTGRCHSFGQAADGFVPGEGCGAILLKPLRKAKEDRDKILATIKGTAINHGGMTSGYTVPNPEAQTNVIASALKRARVDAKTISYIETHGTGTELGDPIEINALTHAFAPYQVGRKCCAVGSVKSNIGHLEAASGIASIIKVVLQMQHKMLVPSLHAEHENPNIDFETTPFYVQKTVDEWKSFVSEDGKKVFRRAGISSFGAGGANAHVILEEYQEEDGCAAHKEEAPYVFLLSAKNPERLTESAQQMVEFLKENAGSVTAYDVAHTLCQCRNEMEERVAIVADSLRDYQDKLTRFAEGEVQMEGMYIGSCGKQYLTRYTNEHQVTTKCLTMTKEEIAEAWCAGEKVDWEQIYPRESQHMILLPNYPFERKRCWFDTKTVKRVDSAPVLTKANDKDTMVFKVTREYDRNSVSLNVTKDGIAIVTMQDHKSKNLFTDDLHLGLIDAFEKINQMEQVKCVVVTGYDHVFCMGGTKEQLDNISKHMAKCSDTSFAYRGFLQCKVPVIAAIQGHAKGGGLVMGLFADMIVMARESVYSINFTQYGFTPGVGATYVVRQKLGFNLGNEMMYTASSYTGEELEKRGVGFKFATRDAVLKEALKLAETIQRKPNITMTTLKSELSERELRIVPQVVESEIRMHEKVFHDFDASGNINRYFGEVADQVEDAGKQAPKPAEQKKGIYQSFQESRIDLQKTKSKTSKKTMNEAQLERKKIRTKEIRSRVMNIVCDLLHVTEAEANRAEDFRDLGIDSISGVEMMRDINKEFQTAIDVVVIYDYCDLDSLSEYIYNEMDEEEGESELEETGEDSLLNVFESVKNHSMDLEHAVKLLEGLYDNE